MKYFFSTAIFFLACVALAAEGHGHGENAIPVKLIIYQTINVVAMFAGLFIVLKKPVQKYFHDKRETYLQAAQKAESARKAAEEERMHIQVRLSKLESTADESVARARAEAADMKKQLIAEAEVLSKRIHDEAAEAARFEVERARNELRQSLIQDAIGAARQQLSSKITAEDHKRLQSDFIHNIQAVQK
jgi:F-type H+-transporting ATPase subunit b